MKITRKAEFSASHFCANPAWSDAENHAVYGDAANRHGHGHNYILEVTVEGEPDPATGMVMDLKVLKDGGAKDVLNPTWATEGLTGSDLVKHMVKHKLEFAPAPPGAGESYETLNKQLSTYLFVLTKKK